MTRKRGPWLPSLAVAAIVLAVSVAPSDARAAVSELWTTIDVDVSNGVVWLEGDVHGRGERRNAITLARTTSGVRAVVAALDVEPE